MSLTLGELHARLLRLGTPDGLRSTLRPAAVSAALDAERLAKGNATPGGVSGLHVRTGRLRGSIAGASRDAEGGGLEIVLRAGGSRAGKDVRYAAIHEYGGTILPKNGKYLRIPTVFGMTAAGVDRYPSPLRATAPGAFRVASGGSGKLWLVPTKNGKSGQLPPPWYQLVTKVTIPARPYLRPALQSTVPLLAARVQTRLAAALGTVSDG